MKAKKAALAFFTSWVSAKGSLAAARNHLAVVVSWRADLAVGARDAAEVRVAASLLNALVSALAVGKWGDKGLGRVFD